MEQNQGRLKIDILAVDEVKLTIEGGCFMERETLILVLKTLSAYPAMFAHIDEIIADWLEDEGFFDIEQYTLTEKAIQYIQ